MTNERHKLIFLTSYPPRECGIATFSQDLIAALNSYFSNLFDIRVCALENGKVERNYPEIVKYRWDVKDINSTHEIINNINEDNMIAGVCLQHEFGLFDGEYGKGILDLLFLLQKPLITTFHTVLPHPDRDRKFIVKQIIKNSSKVVVMTSDALNLLTTDYEADAKKLVVIPHGTHLVRWKRPDLLKLKYGLENNLVLSTFGLLSPNKSIETAIKALPKIASRYPETKYLIIGKTHPELRKKEGEKYRTKLEELVSKLGMENHVSFINRYLSLHELLEYLQLSDVYLFTSKDPYQAVSGTFAYAMSCACPVVSTPIPHAREMLDKSLGEFFDFEDHEQLARSTIKLLADPKVRDEKSLNAFHKTRTTIWENVAVTYGQLLQKNLAGKVSLKYNLPKISLNHLKRMTGKKGILQFSKLGIPDLQSGYTLDDNARALIALIMYYRRFPTTEVLDMMHIYLDFIRHCQRPDGSFYNYTDYKGEFIEQNHYVNLDDSNGRAIWALGFLVSNYGYLPETFIKKAKGPLLKTMSWIEKTHSPRAMAFVIKGLYFFYQYHKDPVILQIVETLSDRLVQLYAQESVESWNWFEGYLTYANGVLPEALLYAYDLTKHTAYLNVAITTLDFLISQTFVDGRIKVVSNRGWLTKGSENVPYGEQPIDVAYTIITLDTFTKILKNKKYLKYLVTAFEWFLGNNHLNQTIYNPASGGCYDGLEEDHPNLNEGAESTVCYLISRLTIEEHLHKELVRSGDKVAGRLKMNTLIPIKQV